MRSTTASMVCDRPLGNSVTSDRSITSPFTRARTSPCRASWARVSRCVPRRCRATLANSRARRPTSPAQTDSTISSRVCETTGWRHWGQWATPPRANSSLRKGATSASVASVPRGLVPAFRCPTAITGGSPDRLSQSGRGQWATRSRTAGPRVPRPRRCPSANTVSKARELFPLPLTPVQTMSAWWGSSREIDRRLWTRAPRIAMPAASGRDSARAVISHLQRAAVPGGHPAGPFRIRSAQWVAGRGTSEFPGGWRGRGPG